MSNTFFSYFLIFISQRTLEVRKKKGHLHRLTGVSLSKFLTIIMYMDMAVKKQLSRSKVPEYS